MLRVFLFINLFLKNKDMKLCWKTVLNISNDLFWKETVMESFISRCLTFFPIMMCNSGAVCYL